MEFTSAEAALLGAIDEQRLVATLVELVRVPSVTGTDPESELQHRLAARLARTGLDVDLWALDLDALRAAPGFPGTEAERAQGWGLVAATGPGTPALVLQGHVDVVPIGDRKAWPDDPFGARIAGGVLHGRGACDMKAGVAVNLEIASALADSGLRLERPLALHSVVSEEDGGLGAFATLVRGHRGDAAVITEPTGGGLVVANAGALTFELRVPGLAAHGSTRWAGHSAIDAFVPVLAALRELETDRNVDRDPLFGDNPLPYPIAVGVVSAGDWASTVPDLLVARGRYGVRLGESMDDAREDFEAALRRVGERDPWLADHPVEVSWPGGQFGSGALADDHPLIEEIEIAVKQISGRKKPDRSAAPYGSDLRLYTGIGGIPTMHYGPGDVRFAHAPREQVALQEVIEVTRALALTVARRCGAYR